MTHTGNYGGDRLSLKLFSALFKFIQKWTKLKLKTDTSLNLAKIYFHLFPNNSQLLLTVS
jgi:heparan sulfate N-deacetylase/N-sulfotransferase NDST2